jgi:hypothetical protein
MTVAEENIRRNGIRYLPFLAAASALAALRFVFRSLLSVCACGWFTLLSRTGWFLLSNVV